MASDGDRLTLRISEPLHDQVKEVARRNHRSVNAQITVWIERGLAADEQGEDQGG